MKQRIIAGILTLSAIASPVAYGETPSKRQSFEEFRKGILSDYQDFRKTLLDRYADFLNGEWHEYESLNGEKRYKQPKPKEVPALRPVARKIKEDTPAVVKPAGGAIDAPVRNEGPGVTETPAVPEKKDETAAAGKQKATTPGHRMADGDEFLFYGLPVQIPKIDFNITQKLYANTDYASQWRQLDKAEVASRLLPHIKKVAEKGGLNDYLTYQLINSYIDYRFPEADVTSRMAAVHYLLANLGYDVRIATTGEGVPLLLIPFNQTIYARTYMMVGSQKYYVFAPDGYDLKKMGAQRISTCRLPEDADHGRRMDLVLGELKIPVKPKPFEFECGPIHLKGEVNENLMPILYHYPQMPVGDFAVSNLQPALRAELASQVKEQLAGMNSDEAAAELLKFMHSVFTYATDEDFHGFEKPYFLEETLYYPKNDCEDRAIFYTWFLWNALGKEAQLISFPGHEAATVKLDTPVEGTYYDYDGERYYISDPTFIGSTTGQIMPPYKSTPPNIDYTFK